MTTKRATSQLSQVFDSYQSGEWRGRRLGRGMDLESIGPYQPGDDIRHIDWQATARIGQPQVKRFHMDIQWTLVIAVDLRSSMYFGSDAQLMAKTACLCAAWLAFALAPSHQRVGFAMIDNQGIQLLAPARGRQIRLKRLVDLQTTYTLGLDAAFKPVNPLDTCLSALADKLAKQCAIILISDFSYPGDNLNSALTALAKYRPGVVVIEDALNQQRPTQGRYPLRLANHPSLLPVVVGRTTDQSLASYTDSANAHRRELSLRLSQAGISDIMHANADTLLQWRM